SLERSDVCHTLVTVLLPQGSGTSGALWPDMKLERIVLGVAWVMVGCGGSEPPRNDGANLKEKAPIEDQRKYSFSDPATVKADLSSKKDLDGFAIKPHGSFTYLDIYLDTKHFDVADHDLSLRFRKRNIDGQITYDFQLKSEKANADDDRLEI